MNPTPRHPTNPTHGATHATVESFAITYTPKAVRWVEPPPAVTHVTVWEPLTLANGGGTLATYRRDTNFAGNLSEAVKVIEFASHGFSW